MKIGLMGGTFNPIHHGHLILSEYVRDSLKLDKIIFIPTGIPAHKGYSNIISGDIRLEMTKMATESNEFFQVSDIETKRSGISYTIDTLKEIRRILPNDQIYFIIGADSLFELPSWKDYEDIIRDTNLIVVNRPGGKNDLIDEKIREYKISIGGNIIKVESPLINISSSDIRNRVKDRKSIKYLLPEKIENFIFENKLYKEGNNNGF